MKNSTQERRAVLQMLLCAALWSTGGILIKLIPWNPFVISGLRSILAAAVVGIYMAASKITPVFTKRSIFTGITLFLTYTCFVVANKLTTAANAIVLQFTAPVFIVLLSALFLGGKFEKADILTVVLTLAGISLFFFDRLGPGRLLGNFMGIASGIMMACMYIGLGSGGGAERLTGILIANILPFFLAIPFFFSTQPALLPLPLLYVLLLGVFQIGLPYILLAKASEHCPPLACSLLGALEPLLNPVWVLLFDGETPGVFALAGGVIVIATVTLWCVHRDRKAGVKQA